MKTILEFNLPDDADELEKAQLGPKYHSVLWELAMHIRQKTKYAEIPKEEEAFWEALKDTFYGLLKDEGIEL